MSEATPSERELDGYRAGADRFIAELDEEYYLHYAGLKPDFELRAIYERHADLTDLETVKRLGETVDGVKTTRSSESIRPGTVIYDVDLTLGLPVPLSTSSPSSRRSGRYRWR